RDRSIRQTAMEKEIQSALKEADVYQEKDDLVRALAAARRAEALLGNGRVRPELREQVAHMMANLRFLTNVQEARLQQTSVKNNRYQMRAADPLYRAAFEDYGLPVLRVEPQEAADRIGRSAIARWLVSALDDWAYVTPDPAVAQKLRAVAKLADRDPVRQEVRDAIQAQRDSTLVSLAGSSEILNQSTITLFLLAQSLRSAHLDVAVQLLRRAQQRHPADFWINERLGSFLWLSKPPDLEESAGFHRVALALRSESPGAHVNLGVVLKDLRQLGAAKVELEEAIRLKPDYAGAHSILAAILHELGKVPESLAEYSEAIRFDPHDAIAHYNLGVLYLDQHQLNRAAAEFAEAIRLNSNSSEAHLGLGDVFSAQGKYVDAIKEYRTAKRSDPDNAEVYNNFGAALRATGEFREAEVVLRRAIQLKPDNASAHYNLGIVLGDLHRLPEAVAAYRQAIHLQADHAEFYINLGTALDDLRQWQEAEEVLTEAVCLGPHDPTAHYNLANVLRELGKLPGAAWEYREAIQLKPEHVLAHYNLGQVLLAQRKLPEAQAAYSKVIRLQPGHALAHNGLGNALYRQRMFFEAEQEYRAALRIQADLVPAQINLGGILLLRGKLDDAAEAYRAALTIEPANIDARCNLGAVLFQQGKHAEAATAIREAIRLQPNSSLAHASLAAVLVHTGQWREAVDAVDRLSQLDSGNEWNWYQSATLHMQIGDVEGYRRACREMLKRFGNTEKPDSEVRITMACLLAPEAVGDFKAVLKLVDRAGQRADKNEPNRRILLAKGLAEYRAGRVTESIGWLTRTSPKSDGASVDATAFAVLALAHHRLGHFTQARAALACAHAILAARLPNPAKGRYFGGDWQDWLHSQILCRETEAAIGTDGTRTKDKNSAGRHRK
ncbi:MAG TPA: tetratricopeptide repeat protein, partial [Gemmataceae bacterium]|nr:tetratricopeptide repeat protein [Gemmataceae bacterium]